MQQAKLAGEKLFVVLIDPDQAEPEQLTRTVALAGRAGVDLLFVGGSLVVHDGLEHCLRIIKELSDIPVILFPGSVYQISERADGILFLSLISGRNAELLIGRQVVAAPYLRHSKLEVLPTGYMLVDGGLPTTASYMSGTAPIPADKDDIARCTAMAGEMLGLRLLYLDAGSGARQPVGEAMIRSVSQAISAPLIVGGGIRTPEKALAAVRAGADVIVVGNAIEKDPGLIREMADAVDFFRAEKQELP